VPGIRREADGCSCGLALDGRLGHAYNEEAFRYLLGVQQKRSERSDAPFLLLLVQLKEHPTLGARIEPWIARKLFAGLWRALREADVIGWYREEQIAGALLTELPSGPREEASRVVTQRVADTLLVLLPSSIADRLQVRVCQIQPRLKS
jgi:hypothetical protein